MANLIKKISTKTVCGDLKKMVAAGEIDKATPIMRIFGQANGIRTGESANGDPWVGFKGNFRAQNLLTGEEFFSGQAFMPDVAADLVAGQFANADANSVEFAFDIVIKPDADSVVGYVYEAAPLMAPAEDDPLDRLAANLPPVKALEKPAKPDTDKGKGADKA